MIYLHKLEQMLATIDAGDPIGSSEQDVLNECLDALPTFIAMAKTARLLVAQCENVEWAKRTGYQGNLDAHLNHMRDDIAALRAALNEVKP